MSTGEHPPIARRPGRARDPREWEQVAKAVQDGQWHTWPPAEEPAVDTWDSADRIRRRLHEHARRQGYRIKTVIQGGGSATAGWRIQFSVPKQQAWEQ